MITFGYLPPERHFFFNSPCRSGDVGMRLTYEVLVRGPTVRKEAFLSSLVEKYPR